MKINLSQWSSQAAPSRRAAPRGRGRKPLARAGFTLVEIMVALTILLLMLAIIFVPLNLGTRFFSIGNSRSHLQQAAQLTLNQITNDLHQAIYVYPNDVLAGVTTNSPYTNNSPIIGAPYYQSTSTTAPEVFVYSGNTATPNSIICGGHTPVGNTSRLDFVLPYKPNDTPTPNATPNSAPYTPTRPAPYLTTYYARRLNAGDTATTPVAYDAVDNPIVLFRAQCPLFDGFHRGSINLTSSRYPASGSCSTTDDRYSVWLAQSVYGEPNLEPMADDGYVDSTSGSPAVVGTHLLITPRGMSLLAPHALDDKAETPKPQSYVPETSFVCEDTNGDGKIDRVRINLALGEFDQSGAVANAQVVRLSETVDLPNIR